MNKFSTISPRFCCRRRSNRLSSISALVVAGTLASILASDAGASGQPATTDETPGDPAQLPLRIVVQSSVDDASLIKGWIRTRNSGVAADVPVFEGHTQWVGIAIGGVTYDYTVMVVAMRDGAPLGVVGEPLRCECTSEQLLELVDEQIGLAVRELQQPLSPPEQPPPVPVRPEPPTFQADTTSERSDDVRDDRRRLHASGSIGIGLVVLGAGAVATGVVLLQQPDEMRGDAPNAMEYSVKPPGIGLAAGGGGALAIGVSLIIVDIVRHRRRSTAVVPAIGPRHVGISISRKF